MSPASNAGVPTIPPSGGPDPDFDQFSREVSDSRSQPRMEDLSDEDLQALPPLPEDDLKMGARVIGRLGHGGFGKVYLVEFDRKGGREAWKHVFVGMEEALAETRIAREVAHDNVVHIYNVEEVPGRSTECFLKMQYVRGEDLNRLVRRKGIFPLSDDTFNLLHQLGDVMQAVHQKQFTHLDLKPANVLLTDDGRRQVKLTDFGLAKSNLGEDPRAHARVGTPFFMAPEQTIPGADRGAHTDIWAFGATVYFLLSGTYHFPFKSIPREPKDAREAALDHNFRLINDEAPIPLPARVPWVPDELWAILARCLEKNPKDRFSTVGDLMTALQDFWTHVDCSACSDSVITSRTRPPCSHADEDCPIEMDIDAQSRLRESGRLFAQCSFTDAASSYRALGQDCSRVEALTSSLAGTAEEWGVEHRDLHESGRALLNQGDLVDALEVALTGIKKFSRSRDLSKLLDKVTEKIRYHVENTRNEVVKLVQKARFPDAESYLGLTIQILESKRATNYVSDDAASSSMLGNLSKTVTDKRKSFDSLNEGIVNAKADHLFSEVARYYSELDANFTLPEMRKLRSQYQTAAQIQKFLEPFPDDAFDALKSGDIEDQPGFRKHLREHEAELSALEGDGFEFVELLREEFEIVESAVRRLDQGLQGALKDAEEAGPGFVEALELLNPWVPAVTRKGLFLTPLKVEFGDRLEQLRARESQWKQAISDGERAESDRKYRDAIDHYRRAATLQPGEDLQDKIKLCETRDKEQQKLANEIQTHALIDSPNRGHFGSHLRSLRRLVIDFESVADAGSYGDAVKTYAESLGRYLQLALDAERDCPEPQTILGAFHDDSHDDAQGESAAVEFWKSVIRSSPDVSRLLCRSVTHAIEVHDPQSPPQECLKYAREVAEALTLARHVLVLCSEQHRHPALTLGEIVVASHSHLVGASVKKGTTVEAFALETLAVLEKTTTSWPKALRTEIERRERSQYRRLLFKHWAPTAKKTGTIAAGLLLLVLIQTYFFIPNAVRRARRDELKTTFDQLPSLSRAQLALLARSPNYETAIRLGGALKADVGGSSLAAAASHATRVRKLVRSLPEKVQSHFGTQVTSLEDELSTRTQRWIIQLLRESRRPCFGPGRDREKGPTACVLQIIHSTKMIGVSQDSRIDRLATRYVDALRRGQDLVDALAVDPDAAPSAFQELLSFRSDHEGDPGGHELLSVLDNEAAAVLLDKLARLLEETPSSSDLGVFTDRSMTWLSMFDTLFQGGRLQFPDDDKMPEWLTGVLEELTRVPEGHSNGKSSQQ